MSAGRRSTSGAAGTRPSGTARARRWPRHLLTGCAIAALVVLAGAAPTEGPPGERAAVPEQSGFATTERPAIAAGSDTAAVEVGVRFTVRRPGTVTEIAYYGTTANVGPHEATVWDSSGDRLGTAELPDVTRDGWARAPLEAPVRVVPGETYVASYHAPRGRYPLTEFYFAASREAGDLVFPRSAGVFRYGEPGYPTEVFWSSSYLVDVTFRPDTAPTPSPSPTPTPDASALPSSPGAPTLRLPREPWWGGPAYYAAFPQAEEAGWTDPGFFPIAVFYGKPEHATRLADVGVNTYMGAEHDGTPMSAITGAGISVVADAAWTPEEVGDDPRVVGWHLSDECEMGYSGCSPDDEQAALKTQRGYAARARALDDGRFLQANFGNGVLGTWWAPSTMDEHVATADVSSVDKYAYTSPHVGNLITDSPTWPAGAEPASAHAYGWLQDRMETFASPAASTPNWVFVEVRKPYLDEPDARTITPDQIEGAVWSAIIHGAAGIAYFQHNNDPRCGNYALVECGEELRSAVRSIDARVARLAPVLNSQPYRWDFGDGLRTSLRTHQGHAYVLAMTDGGSGERTLRLPSGVDASSAAVVGEGRRVVVTDGELTDTFEAESTHHVYRVPLG